MARPDIFPVRFFECLICKQEFITNLANDELLEGSRQRLSVSIDENEEIVLFCAECLAFQFRAEICMGFGVRITRWPEPSCFISGANSALPGLPTEHSGWLTTPTALPARLTEPWRR